MIRLNKDSPKSVNQFTLEEIPIKPNIDTLAKQNMELQRLVQAYAERLRRQGDWKEHYQELSRQHQELRNELERWQKRVSLVELALRHHWGRPTQQRVVLESGFSEQELEEHIWYQLERIEPGLRFCGHQVVCSNCIIDIVAEDKLGKHVLVELKVVQDDPRLVGQVARYPKAYADRFDVCTEDIRVVVIAPGYGCTLRRKLEGLGVTMYRYRNVEGWLEFMVNS